MDPTSPISKTSPMIIHVTPSPVKQEGGRTDMPDFAQSAAECPSSDSPRLDLMEKQVAAIETVDGVEGNSANLSNIFEKISDSFCSKDTTKKIIQADVSLAPDCNVTMSSSNLKETEVTSPENYQSTQSLRIDSCRSVLPSPKILSTEPSGMVQFKDKRKGTEKKIKRRQYRKHGIGSGSSMIGGLEDGELDSSDEDSNDVTLPDLPEVVGKLEISELEKMRESLRLQLNEDMDSSDTFGSNTYDNPCTDNESEHGEAQCPSTVTASEKTFTEKTPVNGDNPSCFETNRTSDGCSFVNADLQKAETKKLSTEDKNINLEAEGTDTTETSTAAIEAVVAENKSPSEHVTRQPVPSETEEGQLVSAADKPPLVMQSSNLLLNYGLDNRHGGGGNETTVLSADEEPPNKKRKLSSSMDASDGSVAEGRCLYAESMNSQTLVDEQPSVEGEDSNSNPAVEEQSSEQNGLMEFDILDEFESDGNDDENGYYDSSDDGFGIDEIDAMLDEKLLEGKTCKKEKSNADANEEEDEDDEHEVKVKLILKARGKNHFDVLPEGWIEVTHNSGMPIYLHKASRVCSMSKPYFLGSGSARKHEIPVSAIPCFHYRKEKEKLETVEKENCTEAQTSTSNPLSDGTSKTSEEASTTINGHLASNGIVPAANLEIAKDTKESESLDSATIREYCEKLFDFQRITVKRFRTWSGRRKHIRDQKQKFSQRPFLPDDTNLITCPLTRSSKKCTILGTNNPKREFIMNPSGKSPVCILHEYVQHSLRVQPKYVFKELENASTPYGAVVVIDGIEYGYGLGSSKKLAKSDAARAALEILIPNMKAFSKGGNKEVQDVEFFDQVRIEDPRVSDLSVRAGQPFPYQILLECLKRNYGMGNTKINVSMKNLKHQRNEFHITCGKHEASVICKNKRDGKHRASQAILQKMHPHISSWGSLLRMYGKGSCKTMKEKKEEEQQITELQTKATANKPNMSILSKLKEEMLKYREKVKSKKPIGKLIPERMELPTGSSSNLNIIEL